MEQRDKDYARELIDLKKQKAALADPDTRQSNIHDVPEKPQGFVNKLKHFWYYYKLYLIGLLIALTITAVCVGSCVSREKEDITVLFLTDRAYFVEELMIVEQALEKYCPDFNNDNNVHVSLVNVYIDSNNPQANYTMQQKLMAQIAAGDAILYISDKTGLDRFNQIGALTELTDIAQNTVNDNKSVSISSKLLFGEAAQETDFYISLRFFEKGEETADTKKGKRISKGIELFKNIVNNNVIGDLENGSNQ